MSKTSAGSRDVSSPCLMASPMLIDTSGQRAKHSLLLTVGQSGGRVQV